ncbi:minor capsid protein [Kutzneria sp. NPDC052558]|uniref:minor capsid protein n=1 Tax=Kutzneria sp. NPDC052558 TaxID=3364121 RepID=UPI0037C87D12
MTVLEEFATLLHELGLGEYRPAGGGTIFLAAAPDAPDAVLALTRAAGAQADPKLPYDEPVLQVRVRGSAHDPVGPEAAAQAVYDALHGLGNRAMPGGTWLVLGVGTDGGPVYAGRDDNARDLWDVKFRMELHRPVGNRQ